MTASRFLGVDVGGSVVKAAVFDDRGQLVADASARSKVEVGERHLAERDPDTMWGSAAAAIRSVLESPDVVATDIDAVGVTGFGNGLFLVDEHGRPTRHGIAAVDTRAADIVGHWRAAGLQDLMFESTYQPFWAGQPLPLVQWLKENDHATLAAARRLLQSKDYIRFKLTGSLHNELTDLASGGLLDAQSDTPAYELFETLGLPEVSSLLPPDAILEPHAVAGMITADAAAETGLREGTPVAAGSMDGLAVLHGSGVSDRGRPSVIGGTWGINQVLAAEHVTDRSVFQSLRGLDDDKKVVVESTPNSMSNFEWYAQNFVKIDGDDLYAHCNERALQLNPPADDPLAFVPHIYATPRHPLRTGSIFGLTGTVGQDQLLRAVYDGIVFEHRVLLERLPGIESGSAVRVAGGIVNSTAWLQILADGLNRRLEVPDTTELGTRGAAMLASVAVGAHASHGAASEAMTRVQTSYEPRPELTDQLEQRYEHYVALRTHILNMPVKEST